MKQLIIFIIIASITICDCADAVWNELHDAIYKKDEDSVAQILRKRRHESELSELLNEQSDNGRTPLHLAVIAGVRAILLKILQYKPDQYICDKWGFLPIHYTAMQQDIEACELLVANGSDMHSVTMKGETTLIIALFSQKPLAALYFLARGVNVHAIPTNKLTAMYWANEYLYFNIVRLLIAQGASTKVKNRELPIPDFCKKNPIVRPIPEHAICKVICSGQSVIIKIPKACWY